MRGCSWALFRVVYRLGVYVAVSQKKMDWKCDDLLFGAEIEEFRTEKTVKADKVTVSVSLLAFSTLELCLLLTNSPFELTLSNSA